MPDKKEEFLRREIEELQALIAKADIADPETCWAVYLLSQCLDRRRQELREATGEDTSLPGSGRNPLIGEQPADTFYAVVNLLDVLQVLPWDEVTPRQKLGVQFALEVAQGALLFEAGACRWMAAGHGK